MKINKLLFTAVTGFAALLVGCQEYDEDKHHYDNQLYISSSIFTKEIKFKAGDDKVQDGLSVAIAKPEAYDIKVIMAPAPELLPTYRMAYYDENAILLPEEYYSMPETSTVISSGAVTSAKLPIEFNNIGNLDRNETYVLPVSVQSADGIGILQSAKNYYYVFRGASLVNVVCSLSKNRAYPDFNNDDRFNNLTENTMEILFKANAFPNQLNTLMGIEGHYLLRLGDAGVPSNQLQVATRAGNLTSADLTFESNKWYHVAVTFNRGNIKVYVNGEEKYADNVSMSSVDLGAKHHNEDNGDRVFWVGYSYSSDRFFDGVVSEVRIWNKELTADEIKAPAHFYTVDPASDGLISYWKFDDGAGQTVKDHTANGYDLTIEKEATWVPVSLPEN